MVKINSGLYGKDKYGKDKVIGAQLNGENKNEVFTVTRAGGYIIFFLHVQKFPSFYPSNYVW